MKTRFVIVFGIYLLSTTCVFGQSVPIAGEIVPAIFESPDNELRATTENILRIRNNETPYRIWVQAEYLMWWVKESPLPIPLITTGNPNVGFPALNTAGAIGQPGTSVVLGDSSTNLRIFSGTRLTVGAWVDSDETIGVEGNGFVLERRTRPYFVGSDAAGIPPLYLPAFNAADQAERALAVADPLRQFDGNVYVESALRLLGAEANGILNFRPSRNVDIGLLGGFRYADLSEHLSLSNTTNDQLFNNTTTLNDFFGTRNQFYGGQLGLRFNAHQNCWILDVTTKVAMGSTSQVVNVNGNITQSGPGAFAPGTFPGGFYAQPTNMGQRSSDSFSVIPAIELKVGYQLTPHIALFTGYNYFYWSNVVRPGQQIDRNINPSQSPIFGGGALVGPPAPGPLFNRSDFWAQGVNFGIAIRF